MSTAAAIAEALLDLKRQMRQHLDETLKASGLSFARYKVLMVLERLGPCRPGEIAEQLRHAPRTLTDALDGLERDGLVRREPHPQDRRALLVHLTEQGRQALDQAKVPRAQALDMVFAPLDASEQAQLLAYLERVRIRN